MTDVPTDTPFTTPVPDPTVATVVLLLLHAPPAVALLREVVEPTHELPLPVINSIGFTRTEAVTIQLEPAVKVIVAEPPATPEMMPVEEPAVATAVLLLLHVPPPASLSVVVPLAQSVLVPVIADGTAFIATVAVFTHPVPNL
jgi:hypothetical protein